MKQQIEKARVALHARTLDIAALGRTRELSLALTTCQQARMLLGVVLRLQGEVTPYPESDNPASAVVAPAADTAGDYDTALPEGDIAAVKEVRRRLGVSLDELGDSRRVLWARDYGTLAEVVYARAFTELALAKNWLGMQLARLAEAPKAPPPKPSPATEA